MRNLAKKREQEPSSTSKALPEIDSKEAQAQEQKVDKPLFKVMVRLCVHSPTQALADSHLRNIVSSFAQFNSLYTSFSKAGVFFKKWFMIDFIYRYTPYFGTTGMITLEEAAKYFRIGENKLRKLAEENPNANWVILNGNRIQIKRKQFEKMIDTVDTI